MIGLSHRAVRVTPLRARTAELCSANAWVEECGFSVPAIYTSADEEHEALSTRVAISDLSARQSWQIDGRDAAGFLSFATLTDAGRIEIGQTARTLWCDDNGFVRGEGLIARFGANNFELSTIVRDFAWMADGVRGFDVRLVNATGSRAVIGVRGPRAPELVAAAGLTGEGAGSAAEQSVPRPAQIALVKGAGGDDFELWVQAEDALAVWDRLWRYGCGFGIAAAGALTLESVRLEHGAPRAGVDWVPAQLASEASDLRLPLDLGFAADASRGVHRLVSSNEPAPVRAQTLVQLTSERLLTSGPVGARGREVGMLTSAAWSYSRGICFALAWVDAGALHPGEKLTAPSAHGPAAAEFVREAFVRQS